MFIASLVKDGSGIATQVLRHTAKTNINLQKGLDKHVDAGASGTVEIENIVLNSPRAGSASKLDKHHNFNEIIDNYAGDASRFDIPTKDYSGKIVRTSELRQIEGSLNSVKGVFEWVIDQNQVTHRRFIPGGKITGIPNQKVQNN